MPKNSERKKLIEYLDDELEFLHEQYIEEFLTGNEAVLIDIEEEMDFIEDELCEIENSRYLEDRIYGITKFTQFREEFLESYDEINLQQILRMSKSSFLGILDQIKHHEIFQNNSNHKQMSVKFQLALALERLGTSGNGASVGRFAREFGISVGTVSLFTQRVIVALLSLKPIYIKWPSEQERATISDRIGNASGFYGCVGMMDGTHIILDNKPYKDAETYINRKGSISLNCLFVCDDLKIIRYAVIGYPGSVHDASIWNKCNLFLKKENYFSNEEYLLVDNGYSCSSNSIPPYKRPQSNLPKNKAFNYFLSNQRVIVEHCNGLLKNRWSSLKGIRRVIKDKKDSEFVVKWIESCIILHNILIMDCCDYWDYDYQNEELDLDEAQYLAFDEKESAKEKRNSLRDHILKWNGVE